MERGMDHISESMVWMKNCLRDIRDDVRVMEMDLFSLKEICQRRDDERQAKDKYVIEMLKTLCKIVTGEEISPNLDETRSGKSDEKEVGGCNVDADDKRGCPQIDSMSTQVNDRADLPTQVRDFFDDIYGSSKKATNEFNLDEITEPSKRQSSHKLFKESFDDKMQLGSDARTSLTESSPQSYKIVRDGTFRSLKECKDSVYIKTSQKLKGKCSYANQCSDENPKFQGIGSSLKDTEYIKQGSVGPSSRYELRSSSMTREKSIYEEVIDNIHFDGAYTCGPFNFTRPLKRVKCVAVLEYIFDPTLELVEEMVDTETSYLTRSSMHCLSPQKCLIDEVININSQMLTATERSKTSNNARNWYLTTRMTAQSVGRGNTFKEFMRKHDVHKHYMGNLDDCENIFIPIHCSNHWLMFLFRVKEEVIEIWDSLLFGGESIGGSLVREVMVNLDHALEADIRKSKPVGWSFKNFRVVTQVDVPQQENETDCGVYVINFMERRNTNHLLQLNVNKHEERASIALKMVFSSCNKSKKKVLDNAFQYYLKKKGIKVPSVLTELGKRRFDENCSSVSSKRLQC